MPPPIITPVNQPPQTQMLPKRQEAVRQDTLAGLLAQVQFISGGFKKPHYKGKTQIFQRET